MGTPSATGLSLPVSGTVAQVQSAFSTPISKYRLSSGKTGYDNAAAPEVDVLGGAPDRGHPRARHAEPSAAVDDRPAGEPGRCPPGGRRRPGDPGARVNPRRTAGSCTASISTVRDLRGARGPDLAQAYAFGPLYSSGDYGAGSTVALFEMSGAGYSPSDISTFATCYGITLANRSDHARCPTASGGATGSSARPRRSSTSRRRSPWRPRRTSRSTRAARRTASTTSSTRSSTTTPPRSSAPAGPTGARPMSASPSRVRRTRSSRRPPRRGSPSSSPRVTRARRAATSTARSRRRQARTLWRRPWTLDGNALHRQQVEQYPQRGQRGQHEQSVELRHEPARCPRARAPTPWRWTPRPARSSWPTPTAR